MIDFPCRGMDNMVYGADMEIKYRCAKENDIDAVCNLVSLAIGNMESRNIYQWDSLYPVRDDFMEDIEKGELFVGEAGNAIVVIYTLNKYCDKEYKNGAWKYADSDFRVIHRLCVHPDYQNHGIAQCTLHHIETELKKKHIDTIRLDVFTENPYALKLYENHGYEKTGYADWRKGRFLLMEKHL